MASRRLTYPDMAATLGITYCRGITPTGHYCNLRHDLNGSTDGETIHFTDRPVTKVDTLAFLKLVAKVRDPDLEQESVPWRRVYRLDRLVRVAGAELGIRLPRRLFRADRAFVLAGVAGLGNDVPMRKQAFDWARR
jgi:hypothetical protein